MMKNLFDITSVPSKGELAENLLSYKNVKIKRIVSSDRLETDTFCQEEAEWVSLVQGSAEIVMNEEHYTLQKGDSLFIPPLQKHTIAKVEKGTVWLAIHIYGEERL